MNYATAVAQVEYNPKVCSDAILQSAVQDAGYDLLVDTGEDAVSYTHLDVYKRQVAE